MYQDQSRVDRYSNFKLLDSIFKDKSYNSYLIVGHRNADIDSVSASIILGLFLKKVFRVKKVTYVFPEGLSSKTIQILKYLRINPNYLYDISNEEIRKYQVAFFLDVGGSDVLGEAGAKILSSRDLIKILVDHHVKTSFIDRFNVSIVDTSASSTIEIILDIISRYSPLTWLKDKYMKLCILALYLETNFLRYATPYALKWITFLMREAGFKFSDIHKVIRAEASFSEKLAYLKALKRMRVYRGNSIILVITNVGAYLSQVSSILHRIGGDIILVYTDKKKQCRVNIRIKEELLQEHSIDVFRDLLKNMQEISYGGHKTLLNIEYKGKVSCRKFLERFISSFTNYLENALSTKFNEISI
ncbi:hypothetical protein DRN87_00340 [Candidatus Geothermarchaeota archaeon]|nr:MAG: hypothetical protein DRN87_00340 [Candidatus Geothermarchaeota archaeon]HEW93700.1 hypothetical protein [Thermoprotei archaeon]